MRAGKGVREGGRAGEGGSGGGRAGEGGSGGGRAGEGGSEGGRAGEGEMGEWRKSGTIIHDCAGVFTTVECVAGRVSRHSARQ